MKVILSRKGFDSEYGGGPSPILPDGRMLSLPIPSKEGRRYGELLGTDGQPIAETLKDLDAFAGGVDACCHLDPDLGLWSVPRQPGWKPSFGPGSGPAGHLDGQGVGGGDLFLFFGWFRQTEFVNGTLRFVRPRQDLQVIFGWLEVGEIVRPGLETAVASWLADHPHCTPRHRAKPSNRIYVAADHLSLLPDRPGAGVFRHGERLVLTKPGMTRSRWGLDPEVFGDVEMTFHSPASWKPGYFQSAAKGQEFVLTANQRVRGWLDELFKSSQAQHPGC